MKKSTELNRNERAGVNGLCHLCIVGHVSCISLVYYIDETKLIDETNYIQT